jgi:ABC-type uncharacterized transport system auxiliary subunit
MMHLKTRHMTLGVKIIAAIFPLFLFLSGCAGFQPPARTVQYYTLEYEPTGETGERPVPETIRVERLQVSPLYDTDRLVFREKAFLRDQYQYHRWRSTPMDMATYFLTRDMAQSRLFKGVFSNDSLFPATYRLSGTVLDFCEADENDWYALLSLDIILVKSTEPDVNRRVVFQKVYKAKTRCKEKTPLALAEAMSKAMAMVSTEIISDVYHHIAVSSQ